MSPKTKPLAITEICLQFFFTFWMQFLLPTNSKALTSFYSMVNADINWSTNLFSEQSVRTIRHEIIIPRHIINYYTLFIAQLYNKCNGYYQQQTTLLSFLSLIKNLLFVNNNHIHNKMDDYHSYIKVQF